MMSDFEQDVDQRLEALDQKETELKDACNYMSACRVAKEIQRLAKAEGRLIPYIHATFTLMNSAYDVLDLEMGRESSIELIGLLESEDRARSIQSNLPEDIYESNVNWLLSCGYDNLAKAVAEINGYNSQGMHECISDGLQVCRRTGKLECITCFREYAGDVYKASDDLEMAMHYARAGIAHENPGPNDRRWAGAKDLVNLQVLNGDLQAACESVELSWQLAETWHSPDRARMLAKLQMEELSCLIGNSEKWSHHKTETITAGEFPWVELRSDQVKAVAACYAKDYSKAIELLTKWDRKLTECLAINTWFDNRLRLLSVHRLAGNLDLVNRLANQLEAKAKPARDWLTMRLLARIRDESAVVGPVPMVADPKLDFAEPRAKSDLGNSAATVQETASSLKTTSRATSSGEEVAHESGEDGKKVPPTIKAILERMAKVNEREFNRRQVDEEQRGSALGVAESTASKSKSELGSSESNTGELNSGDSKHTDPESDSREEILADVMAMDKAVSDTDLACWILHVAYFLLGDCSEGKEVWAWARKVAEPHRHDATCINLLARLGAAIKFGPNEELDDEIQGDYLEKLFRESLDVDPNIAKNFGRAGDYFRMIENVGDAEWCFARGFRLDRSNSAIAMSLSEIYQCTDRERDALAVLDMAIRENDATNGGLLWQASMLARGLDQNEACLTYMDAFEVAVSDSTWAQYYRASALLNLERYEEALAATKLELERNPDCKFACGIQAAAAHAGLKKYDALAENLEEVFSTKLSTISNLTTNGLGTLFFQLWKSCAALDPSPVQMEQLEDLILATGLAPDELFDRHASEEVIGGLSFYEVLLVQPVSESWDKSAGCLHHELGIDAYRLNWGVLAQSEEQATKLVLQWQKRCYRENEKVEVASVEAREEGFQDRARVVWQGYREGLWKNDSERAAEE